MVATNRARAKLAEGDLAFGAFLRQPDAALAELLALHDLDFVIFDGEHGPLSAHACEHLARAVELHGATPGVRVEENRSGAILRYLDAGALICHVPGIESAEEAAAAVSFVKFRPRGNRGLSASRASGGGARGGFAEYIDAANRETQVVVHVESAAGVAAAAEIAEVDGVDVLLFGALDLSHDLGHAGQLDHPDVLASAEAVARATSLGGKALGAVAGDAAEIQTWIDRGARYLLTTLEALLRSGVTQYLGDLREATREPRC